MSSNVVYQNRFSGHSLAPDMEATPKSSGSWSLWISVLKGASWHVQIPWDLLSMQILMDRCQVWMLICISDKVPVMQMVLQAKGQYGAAGHLCDKGSLHPSSIVLMKSIHLLKCSCLFNTILILFIM